MPTRRLSSRAERPWEKRVDQSGASNTKNEVGGYSVVQAESHDAATKIFGQDHPHLMMPGAWIEITEIMPMPGM